MSREPASIEFYELARNGGFAERSAAAELAAALKHPTEREEFTALCLIHLLEPACNATADFYSEGGLVQCQRREHAENPWHVAIRDGRRFVWGPRYLAVRPIRAGESVP